MNYQIFNLKIDSITIDIVNQGYYERKSLRIILEATLVHVATVKILSSTETWIMRQHACNSMLQQLRNINVSYSC